MTAYLLAVAAVAGAVGYVLRGRVDAGRRWPR